MQAKRRAGGNPTAAGNPSAPRKYGFACSNCRRRKARCNGALPACQKCTVTHETCSYDKAPSVAYAVSLQNLLQAYKERFERLREVKDGDRDVLLDEPICAPNPNAGQSRAFPTPCGVSNVQSEANDVAGAPNDAVEEASVGADGRVCFYGKTSLYHIDPQDHEKDGPGIEVVQAVYGGSRAASITPTPPLDNRTASFLAEIPPTLLEDLLAAYWCWAHHLHNVLCKRLFLRDLYSSGECVTPFLVSVVLAQAARYSTRSDAAQVGDHFARKALQLLPRDIDQGSSIPTIQGLLIFSARECACGRISQGWLYSGMAFRMMRDLGIDVSPKKLGHLAKQFSEEDLSLRQQVFWSCYTWDKTMSLCLGRTPNVHCTIELPTPETLPYGREADDEIWIPMSAQVPLVENLLKQKAFGSMRFSAYCELCVIIESVLDTLYSRPHSEQQDHLLAYLTSTLQRLQEWADRLPPELFIRESAKTIVCPPLHILLLNLVYHATAILLCRPYRAVYPSAKERCTKATQMIDTLFMLHVRRFGFRFTTYLQTYTMFVACTIHVLDVNENIQSQDADRRMLAQEASARLDFGLEVLRQASSTPSAARCAAIISRLLRRKDASRSKYGEGTSSGQNASYVHCAAQTSSSSGSPGDQYQVVTPSLSTAMASSPLLEPPQRQDKNQSLATAPATSLPSFQSPFLETTVPQLSNRNRMAAHPGFGTAGLVEKPLRWLPENVQDDGSWMLMMDMDFDFDLDLAMTGSLPS